MSCTFILIIIFYFFNLSVCPTLPVGPSGGEEAFKETAGVCVHTEDSVLKRGRVCFLIGKQVGRIVGARLKGGDLLGRPGNVAGPPFQCLPQPLKTGHSATRTHCLTSWNSSSCSALSLLFFLCMWDRRRWTNSLIFSGRFTT